MPVVRTLKTLNKNLLLKVYKKNNLTHLNNIKHIVKNNSFDNNIFKKTLVSVKNGGTSKTLVSCYRKTDIWIPIDCY